MESNTGAERIRATLSQIIGLFRTGEIPEAIAVATFPPYQNVPSTRWSLLNRIIMNRSDSSDARGFHQWKEVGRYPKKGSKAIHILGPRMVRKPMPDDPEEEGRRVVAGFVPIPVFRAEDTSGDPLHYEPISLPELPLLEKAQKWGIDVRGITFQGEVYGFYRQKDQEIRLASPSERVFFHELSHAAHSKIVDLRECPESRKEIVAELSAQVLAHLVGTRMEDSLGNSYRYIEHYSRGGNVARACLKVVSEVERVLKLILEDDERLLKNGDGQ